MLKRLCIFVAVLGLTATGVLAQTTVGKISGKVFDSSGAVVPNGSVSAVSTSTGLGQNTTTDERGFYAFPSLPAGTYNIKVEASGFKPSTRADVILDAASRRSIDFTLE